MVLYGPNPPLAYTAKSLEDLIIEVLYELGKRIKRVVGRVIDG